jgi:tetratricopeptide (TPR) repeat protein
MVELFLVWCEVRAVQGILCSPSPRDRLIRLGMLSGFWAALGGSLIDMPFHRPPQVYLLAILLGACLPMPASRFGIPELRIRRGRIVSLASSVVLLPLGVWMLWQASLRYVAIRDVFWAQAVLSGKLAGGDTAKAGETIRKTIARVPGEGEYQCNLAEFLVHAGADSGAGVAQIRRSRLLSDRPELYLLEARAQIERNNLEAAEPILVFMESLDRESPQLHYLKGRAAQQAGHTHSARSSYLSAINFSETRTPFKPDLQDAYLRLARILEELGETGEAVKYYEKFLASLEGQSTSYPIAELSLARMYRDNFYDYDLADKYYQQALAIFKRQGNAKEIRRIEQDLEAMRERIARMK